MEKPMHNTITFTSQNGELVGTYEGTACRYAYEPSLRTELDRLKNADRRANRFFVYENATLRAAGPTITGVEQYMDDTRVLVAFDDSCRQPFPIGTQYKTRGKAPKLCTVTEIFKTFNSKGELVKITYESQHSFMGQMVTERDVIETTIAMGLIGN
jgi:hypothetical protein